MSEKRPVTPRRDFLLAATMLGAGGAILGLPGLKGEARGTDERPKLFVQVHGEVEGVSGEPPPNGFRTVIGSMNLTVAGFEDNLSGVGFVYVDDPELGATPADTICVFHQRGQLVEESGGVDVSGKVFYAGEAETAFRNLLINTKANFRSGTIVFNFGPHVFRTTVNTGRGVAFKTLLS